MRSSHAMSVARIRRRRRVAGTADVTAPTISIVSYNGSNVLEITVSENSTVYWMVDDNASRTAAQVKTGGGLCSGSFTVTSGANSDNIVFTNTDGLHYLHLMAEDGSGNQSTVTSAQYTFPDTLAPSLSSATGTQTGATTADWGVTSDEAGGTIYAAVRLSTDAVLSKSNIENGTGDAVAISTDATPTADANNGGSFTGLTGSTEYIVDVFQRDADGNESAVVSSSAFTTAAAATSPSIVQVVSDIGAYNQTGGGGTSFAITLGSTSNTVALVVLWQSASTVADTSMDTAGGSIPTIGGNTMAVEHFYHATSRWHLAIYSYHPNSTAEQTIVVNPGNDWRAYACFAHEVQDGNTTTICVGTSVETFFTSDTCTVTKTTSDVDGLLLAAALSTSEGTPAITATTGTIVNVAPAGSLEGQTGAGANDDRFAVASIEVASAAASESIVFAKSGHTTAAIMVELNPA